MKAFWRLPRPSRDAKTVSRRFGVRPVETAGPTLPPMRRILLPVVTAVCLAVLLCIHLLPNRVALRLGDVADHEILAQRTVRFEDTEATARLRRDAIMAVDKQYVLLSGARRGAIDAAAAVFDAVANAPSADAAGLLSAEIERQSGVRLTDPATLTALKSASGASLAVARRVVETVVGRMMDLPLRDDTGEVETARRTAMDAPELKSLSEPLRTAVAKVCAAALSANRRYDSRETDRLRTEAGTAVSRQFRRIAAGQAILRPGERVTQASLDAFAALGLQNASLDAATIGTIAMMVVLMVLLVAVFLKLYQPRLYEDTSQLWLLAVLSIISVAGIKIGSTLLGLPFSGVHFAYLGMMCVASAGMVIALLVSPSVATLVVSLLSVASGVVLNNELRFTLITLGSALAGIVAVATLRNRTDLMRAGLILCGANAVLNGMVGQLEGDTPKELLSGMLWGLVSGGVALMLFYLGVAVFERLFKLTTHLRLLELSDPATPILQEFRMRVPGTYAHSLMVGNLAHAAAEAIEADALLVRVGAYYHDLGKMNRPEFFIENQTGENVHENLNPSLSAIVLASHVKEGLEMGAAVGLPPRVLEVISQHHGTSLMRYFYHRATDGVPNPQLEAQFRYPGPKPQTKEAAILMLADGVEAASRTLVKPTPQRLAEFVAGMVDEKRADGQLDECDLTLRDLKTVEGVFVHILSGTLHGRIAYPNSPANAAPNPTNDENRPSASAESQPPAVDPSRRGRKKPSDSARRAS